MDALESCKWRAGFWHQLIMHGTSRTQEWIALGGQTELETAVAAILREHGVFHDRVLDRAKLVINKIGQPQVLQAMKATRPWAALKELANDQVPKLRLVMEDGFSKVVHARTGNQQHLSTRKRPNKSHSSAIAMFTPSDIAVPEGVFCQSDGSALMQVQVRNLTPTTKGIVILSEHDAQPFVSQKTMSKEGLAFLILPPFSDALAQQGEQIRFPAQCVQTGEPVLLNAIMIQKGQMLVKRVAPAQPLRVETVPSQTVKILAYRDQIPSPWPEFMDRPIKAMLDALPCLRVCKNAECNCPCWHAGSESAEPILDIWQRDFLNVHFKKSKPSDASIFACMLRITTESFTQISGMSGVAGIYVEARSPDGKHQDQSFHTVWLNKSTLQEARATQTTTTCETSLIRVSNRYGLRVRAAEAKQLHDIIKPEVPFLGGTAKTTWLVGPVPYGTTRKGLGKLFMSWEWEAKPLQPAGPSADKTGLRWQVISNVPPPNYVYTLEHGDVLIVKSDPHEVKPNAYAQVEASASSCKAVATMSNAALIGDPWAEAAAKLTKPASLSTTANSAQLAAMESTLEQRILEKMQVSQPDTEMHPDWDPRISALESQMKQLQSDQKTLATQQSQLNHKVEHIGQQLDAQTGKLQNHLDERLQDQMQRIEALLCKRPRQE